MSERCEVAQGQLSSDALSFTRSRGRAFRVFVLIAPFGLAVHSYILPQPYIAHLHRAIDRIIAFVPRIGRYPASQDHIITLLLPRIDMAPRGRFHELPADNTHPIEDFDMFKTMPKRRNHVVSHKM